MLATFEVKRSLQRVLPFVTGPVERKKKRGTPTLFLKTEAQHYSGKGI